MGLHEDEDRKFAEDVQAVKNWWSDSRWRFTKRPFTAEAIVAKRGTLTVQYPSAVQAKKLWSTLENNWQVCYTPALVEEWGLIQLFVI
jgi:isocitrate lyase